MGLLRTTIEGHEETLDWRDFQGSVPANRSGGDDAQTETRFDMHYDYDFDTAQGTHHGYRLGNVQVKVIVEQSKMWVVPASKSAVLLKHEQGHYDIVALVARDLYDELTGWGSANPPKRFRKDTDLKSAADRQLRQARSLAARLSGTSSSIGVYDTQTKHGKDAKAQEEWDKAIEAARSGGTRLMTGLSGLGARP